MSLMVQRKRLTLRNHVGWLAHGINPILWLEKNDFVKLIRKQAEEECVHSNPFSVGEAQDKKL